MKILVYHHLSENKLSLRTILFCCHSAPFDDFSILTCEKKKFLLFKFSDFLLFTIFKCMSTIVRDNDNVQFIFFLVMRLNITIVTSCDSLIALLVPKFFSLLKLGNVLSNTFETWLEESMDSSNYL